jgi:plasmid stabilization system protein ParE
VTPSARDELLEVVAHLRRRSPAIATHFVRELEDRLADIEEGGEDPPELESPWRSAQAAEGHRIYLRERTNGLWLIAVWPDTVME